ncbi:hypothetical protein [Desulfohalovibrio reitneri]|uniref:hypothetical protein n=1 Tax=Desulfohalovibrio reitneri TaxID=1307759 RepID=UPI0004A76D74|nr:hypothetical protein [Desulfohalovibrio reitneri]
MPQVAARISQNLEDRIKGYFKTKGAGAEFLLPWVIDTFDRTLAQLKTEFSSPELKTFLEAYRDQRILPEHCRLPYLQLRMREACGEELKNTIHGAGWPTLERKIDRLSDVQAATLMVWAAAYWSSPEAGEVSMDEYVRPQP